MKLVDLNVLVYASDEESPHHGTGAAWLDAAMVSTETICLPVVVSIGFIRIVTNARIMKKPIDAAEATAIVQTWRSRRNVTVPMPGPRHYELLAEMLAVTGTGGNLVTDAHLAALAKEQGATIVSYDSDFNRFPGIAVINPADLG